ncbi:MAG: aminotransferase [Chlamydiales bacterium 38-26]|nr:aminotransferase class I/II-fold pyridoxal phosphate-dependent enzyme [Chlamydiales bacterium]OJV11525.1 MAG: aminotransferase [Chlamydiales bacterium 38-26]
MPFPHFKLEEFWKKYEFNAPYLLCPSDVESWSLGELVDLADPESKELWTNLRLGYTESPGHPLLRTEIAKLYTSLNSHQVLTTAGAEEGIYCTMRALLSPGDHIIVVTPCYDSLEVIPSEIGAEITRIALDPNQNWKLQLGSLQKAFRLNTKLLVLNYPHNPTGTLLDQEVLHGMVDLARRCGCYIFSDEVYRYLEVDEAARLPSIVDAYERGVTLNVMTKAFGLAGLRIGWLASRDVEFIQKAGSYKLYLSICNSAPSEILALIALRAKSTLLKRNRKIMLHNLNILDAFMERQSHRLSWIRPQSGSVAFMKLLMPIPIEQFAEQLVEKTGVLIMPGTIFDIAGNFFRIGFGRKDMPDVLERFEDYLNAL